LHAQCRAIGVAFYNHAYISWQSLLFVTEEYFDTRGEISIFLFFEDPLKTNHHMKAEAKEYNMPSVNNGHHLKNELR
jgi:hypothetical protein